MQLPYPPYRGSRGWELYPWSYLVSYVWSHFPRVPSILQQHRLVLITVQQFVRLPYLKNRQYDRKQHMLLCPSQHRGTQAIIIIWKLGRQILGPLHIPEPDTWGGGGSKPIRGPLCGIYSSPPPVTDLRGEKKGRVQPIISNV